MRYTTFGRLFVGFLLIGAGCASEVGTEDVTYLGDSSATDPWPEAGGPVSPGAGPAGPAPGPMEGAAGAGADLPGGDPAPALPGDTGTGPTDGPAADPGVAAPPPVPTDGSTPTSLTVDFVSVTQNGQYAPDNIGAVWAVDASGRWVRTLEFWAFIRAAYLSTYNSSGAGLALDAISSATLPLHGPHHSVWDLHDTAGQEVPDGSYTIMIEVTESESHSEWISIPFEKNGVAQVIDWDGGPYFQGVTLKYQ